MNFTTRLQLGLFGIVGSFAPCIVKMYNQLPNIAFVFEWQWAVVVLLYGLLGGLIAMIYPYSKTPSPWSALLLGCSFPAILGVAASVAKTGGPGSALGPGGAVQHWGALDYLSLL